MSITATESGVPWRAARAISAASRSLQGAVVGQAGQRVGRRLGGQLGAVLDAGDRGGEQVAELHQSLLVAAVEGSTARHRRRPARPRSPRRPGSAPRCSSCSRGGRPGSRPGDVDPHRPTGQQRLIDVAPRTDDNLGARFVAAALAIGPGPGDDGRGTRDLVSRLLLEPQDPRRPAMEERRSLVRHELVDPPRDPDHRRPRWRPGAARPAQWPAARRAA